jgi:DNA-binding Lrp family transcriptional regulator
LLYFGTKFTFEGFFRMDDVNIKLITQMQENADLSLLELSRRVGISKTACWNRLQKMEEQNVILGKKILFDRYSIGLPIVVFLSISVGRHTIDWVDEFSEVISKFPEIIEAHRLTGEGADYQLKIICPSMEAYDILQQQLIGEIDFTAMSTKISLKQIKNEYSLPLSHLEKLNKFD